MRTRLIGVICFGMWCVPLLFGHTQEKKSAQNASSSAVITRLIKDLTARDRKVRHIAGTDLLLYNRPRTIFGENQRAAGGAGKVGYSRGVHSGVDVGSGEAHSLTGLRDIDNTIHGSAERARLEVQQFGEDMGGNED